MFGLYIEHFTIIARGGLDMDTFEDLKGKRVYVGGEDLSRRHVLDVLMDAHGWTGDKVTDVSTFKASNLAEALCDDEFDAFVYTIGHPNPTVREAAILCDINLVDVSPEITVGLARQNPFFVKSVIWISFRPCRPCSCLSPETRWTRRIWTCPFTMAR